MTDDETCHDRLRYDAKSGKLFWKNGRNSGKEAGAKIGARYAGLLINGKRFYAHRIIWFFETGMWPVEYIDHANGNGLDNRFSNLRLASPRENQRNKKKPKSNTSGVKGVSWRRDRKTWSVRISTGDKQASLGSFSNIEDAREAYASGAQKYFGEFARME